MGNLKLGGRCTVMMEDLRTRAENIHARIEDLLVRL